MEMQQNNNALDYGTIVRNLENGITLRGDSDEGKQFIIYRINDKKSDNIIKSLVSQEAEIEGSDNKPDAFVDIELVAFNIANRKIGRNEKGTMQIILGGDDSDPEVDKALWVINAGFEMKDLFDKEKKGNNLGIDGKMAFKNKPIEIKDGIATISFNLFTNKNNNVWRKIFRFSQNSNIKKLTSLIGLPGVTHDIFKVVNNVVNKFKKEDIFKSKHFKFALTERAKKALTNNNESTKVGVLNPGFYLMFKKEDYSKFSEGNVLVDITTGKIEPTLEDSDAPVIDNPFDELDYTVFRINAKETNLKNNYNVFA